MIPSAVYSVAPVVVYFTCPDGGLRCETRSGRAQGLKSDSFPLLSSLTVSSPLLLSPEPSGSEESAVKRKMLYWGTEPHKLFDLPITKGALRGSDLLEHKSNSDDSDCKFIL